MGRPVKLMHHEGYGSWTIWGSYETRENAEAAVERYHERAMPGVHHKFRIMTDALER